MENRTELNLEMLENVAGGAIGFNPEPAGTYTMRCQFTGAVFPGVTLANVMEIAKFAATIPNTLEGEQQIIKYASDNHYINI